MGPCSEPTECLSMKKISKKTKIIAVISICLWIIGSVFLLQESNSKFIILFTAVIIITGIYSRISRDIKTQSQLGDR